MNILPKKSWHVRNKNNIEKVRRDEEKAAKEEQEKQRRIALAESEARTDLLRVKASRKRPHDDEINLSVEPQTSNKHINFFEDLEQGKKIGGKNVEYEEEKKKEKEAQEKSIGLLTYLGQGSVELKDEKPWYYKPPQRSKDANADKNDLSKDEIDTKRKKALDPMYMMDRYISVSKKVEQAKDGKLGKKPETIRSSVSASSSVSRPQSVKTIEELRAERLKREEGERQRERQLLARLSGQQTSTDKEELVDERQMKYNSQFNPDFVRRPKPTKQQYS